MAPRRAAAWAKKLESGDRPEAVRSLQHWLADRDLTSVRDTLAVAGLPESERGDWVALWAEVEASIVRGSSGGPDEPSARMGG
jgi:hypothetical protein